MGRNKGSYNPKIEKRFNELLDKHPEFSSQAAVARKIEMDPTNFNHIIKGRNGLTDEVAKELSKIFEVSPSYIQCYTDDPNMYYPKELKEFDYQRDVFREYCDSIGIEFCYNKDAFSSPESGLVIINGNEKGYVDSIFYKHYQNAVQNAALNILEAMLNTINTQQMYWRELLDTGSISDMPEKDYSKPLD